MKTTKQGVIIKKLDQRTAVVETFLMKSHPLYHKKFKVVKKYLADDKDDKFKVGDIVYIQECRPISKKKYFEITKKVGTRVVGEEKIVGEEILGAEEPAGEEKEEIINNS